MKITNPFNYKWPERSSKYLYNGILIMIISVLLETVSYKISFFRIYFFTIITYLLRTISVYYILSASIKSKGWRYFENKPIKNIVNFMLLWLLINLIISIPDIFSPYQNYVGFKQLLKLELLLYVIPFVLIYKPNLLLIKRVFLMAYFLLFIYFLLMGQQIVNFSPESSADAEYAARNYASGGIFLLLTSIYHSRKVNRVVLISMIISILFMLLYARRNMVLYFSSALFFYGLIIMFSSTSFLKRKRTQVILSLFLTLFFAVFFYWITNLDFSFFAERVETGFSSREGVVLEFTDDFNQSNDWWLGRGVKGEFISKYLVDNEVEGTRGLIENGYLFLILKSGLLYLIPFLTLSLVAFYKGFNKSKNVLSKAAAAIVFINLLDMVGYGLPSPTLKYFFVYLSLVICLSKSIRYMSDERISQIIGIK